MNSATNAVPFGMLLTAAGQTDRGETPDISHPEMEDINGSI